MSGHISGLAALVKKSPLAIYIHCKNHKLDLVVQNIKNFIEYLSILGLM